MLLHELGRLPWTAAGEGVDVKLSDFVWDSETLRLYLVAQTREARLPDRDYGVLSLMLGNLLVTVALEGLLFPLVQVLVDHRHFLADYGEEGSLSEDLELSGQGIVCQHAGKRRADDRHGHSLRVGDYLSGFHAVEGVHRRVAFRWRAGFMAG